MGINAKELKFKPKVDSALSPGVCTYVTLTPYGLTTDSLAFPNAKTFTCPANVGGVYSTDDWGNSDTFIDFEWKNCKSSAVHDSSTVSKQLLSGTSFSDLMPSKQDSGVCRLPQDLIGRADQFLSADELTKLQSDYANYRPWYYYPRTQQGDECVGTYEVRFCGPALAKDTTDGYTYPKELCGDIVGCLNFDRYGFGLMGAGTAKSNKKYFDYNNPITVNGVKTCQPYWPLPATPNFCDWLKTYRPEQVAGTPSWLAPAARDEAASFREGAASGT